MNFIIFMSSDIINKVLSDTACTMVHVGHVLVKPNVPRWDGPHNTGHLKMYEKWQSSLSQIWIIFYKCRDLAFETWCCCVNGEPLKYITSAGIASRYDIVHNADRLFEWSEVLTAGKTFLISTLGCITGSSLLCAPVVLCADSLYGLDWVFRWEIWHTTQTAAHERVRRENLRHTILDWRCVL